MGAREAPAGYTAPLGVWETVSGRKAEARSTKIRKSWSDAGGESEVKVFQTIGTEEYALLKSSEPQDGWVVVQEGEERNEARDFM